MMTSRLALFAALPALSACATAAPPPPASGPCPIVASSDWRAWVNAMPGPDRTGPHLIVVGNVTVPSAEWTASFVGSRVMESYPVQVVVELDATRSGMGIQVPVTREVRGSWPSEQAVGSVTVMCRGTTLARISPVETAH
jgi:hypothetical protein